MQVGVIDQNHVCCMSLHISILNLPHRTLASLVPKHSLQHMPDSYS